MIVDVHSGQQRRPGRTAHGRRDVGVPAFGPLRPYRGQRLRHEVQRAQFHVLIVGEDQDDVGFARGRSAAPAAVPAAVQLIAASGRRRRRRQTLVRGEGVGERVSGRRRAQDDDGYGENLGAPRHSRGIGTSS